MDSITLLFGAIFHEHDHEADFLSFLSQRISENVQLILDIMYEGLSAFQIPGKGVDSKLYSLLRPIRQLLGPMTHQNKPTQWCVLFIVLGLLLSTPIALATNKEVAQIKG